MKACELYSNFRYDHAFEDSLWRAISPKSKILVKVHDRFSHNIVQHFVILRAFQAINEVMFGLHLCLNVVFSISVNTS